MPVARWTDASIQAGGFRVLDLSRDVALSAGLIPDSALADPIDRCLVATSREHALPLVTADRKLVEYAARTKQLTVIDASR